MKSSYSEPQENCVDVHFYEDGSVKVSDTKDGENGPHLHFTPEEWDAFTAGVKDGEFDRPTNDREAPMPGWAPQVPTI